MYPFCVLPYSTLSIPNLLEHILKNEKKIIFSLYYVSVAKNGVFVHKHLRFWNKRKIPPKDSHFSARNPHEYSKLFFISVMLWKAKKKKYLKKN